ncbi:MAG: hypothetical protein HZA32_07245 [Opitutae bacterium]|nr:hypothetical protein [Opitutae bacterium]
MNMKSILAAFFAIVSVLAAVAGQPKNVMELFGGAEAMAVLRTATRVEACFLKRSGTQGDWKWDETPYALLSDAGAARLRKLLLDEATYAWDETSAGSSYSHNISVRFTQGGHTLKILFLLDSDYLAISYDGAWRQWGEEYRKRSEEFFSIFESELSHLSLFAEIRNEKAAREAERAKYRKLEQEALARDRKLKAETNK